ncbi:unnamed protein product [Triticum turgidum subsp. durum]|uniref:Lipase-like PAD4 n=1 Tax=Triticum turgidum subsp. durum TaxID=4567 RepID=A0A9R0W943_TRITD|nr:unnamed protein product [Triticum turgidum subsp. durum]
MLLNQIRGKAVVFTGHSLGGAIAALAALHYLCISSLSSSCSPSPVLCVTFGSPLLGNEALSRAILRERWGGNFCNVVSQHDVVPRLLFCPLDAVPVRVIIGMQLQQWPGHTHNTGVMTIRVVDADQEGLRQLIQAHVRTVAMEQKLVDPESRGGSPYRPFGAYVLCSPEGAVCVDNSTAAVQMLYATFAACYARGDTSSLEAAHSCYGDLVLKMPQNLLLKRRPHGMDIEWYKASFDADIGYYDAFKQQRSPKKFGKANIYRLKLGQFWDGVLTMLDNSQLPHDFHRRAKWVNAARFYQLLVEPLDIADYHRNNLHKTRGGYITHGRDRRYELFDKWWKEKGDFSGTSTGDTSVTATARSKYAGLTQDPCFWARVEEAWDQTESAQAEYDVAMLAMKLGRLREFERYARELVESKEVSIDVLAPQSSYTRWVEEWKKLLLRDEARTASLF